MQENQALNARPGEMNSSHNEMQQTMNGLKQQLLQNQERRTEVRKPGFLDKAKEVVSGVLDVGGKVAGVVAVASKCSVM